MTVDDHQDPEWLAAFLEQVERVRDYRDRKGHPPPLYRWSGPTLFAWPWVPPYHDPEAMDRLLEMVDVLDLDARAALILLLVYSARDDIEGASVDQSLRCQAFARQALDVVDVSAVETVVALRLELAAAARAGI